MRVVLDTNVVVSGVLSEMGPPGQLLDLALASELTLVVEPRILGEYREVLARPKLHLDQTVVGALLETLDAIGFSVTASPWPHRLPDPDDEVFIAAAAAGIATLVTGNMAHFPPACRAGLRVLTPREALEALRTSA